MEKHIPLGHQRPGDVSATVGLKTHYHTARKGSIKIPSALLTPFSLPPVSWRGDTQYILTLQK